MTDRLGISSFSLAYTSMQSSQLLMTLSSRSSQACTSGAILKLFTLSMHICSSLCISRSSSPSDGTSFPHKGCLRSFVASSAGTSSFSKALVSRGLSLMRVSRSGMSPIRQSSCSSRPPSLCGASPDEAGMTQRLRGCVCVCCK